MSVLSKPYFHDEAAAFEHLEAVLWDGNPVCPHCGSIGRATKLKGSAHRLGVWKCNEKECRKQFTVKVGTVFEHGRMPLCKMLQAVYLLCSSKKGISSHQLARTLEVTYKTAWFLSHRIREAMRDGKLSPLGGEGAIVEMDETLSGKQEGAPKRMHHGSGWQFRNVVFTLVQRGGSARSFHVDGTTIATLMPIIRANIANETAVMTDSASWYRNLNKDGAFVSHDTINHTDGEYVRYGGERLVHTNTVEGYYSIFKRGMKGVYQHCAEKHLHRYLAEFDFRYNQRVALGVHDEERAGKALRGIAGKRLTYRVSSGVGGQ